MAVEVRGIKIDRVAGEQRLVAFAASAAFVTPFRGDAVERVAMRAGNGDGLRRSHIRSHFLAPARLCPLKPPA